MTSAIYVSPPAASCPPSISGRALYIKLKTSSERRPFNHIRARWYVAAAAPAHVSVVLKLVEQINTWRGKQLMPAQLEPASEPMC